MENHYHFFIETPLGNVSEFMRYFNITYTSYYNRKHRRTGHLFQGRYKSILVEKDEYAVMLSHYIHLKPVRTKESQGRPRDEKMRCLMEYPFSSLPGYVDVGRRNPMVVFKPVLDAYGGDTPEGRKAYREAITEGVSGSIEIHDKIVAQSILGSEHFIESVGWVEARNPT
jgi:putative transposase